MSNLTELDTGIEVTIYKNSKIIANNHTFNYVGSGVTYNALSENNGQVDDYKRITNINFGSIYYSSNNEVGIFEIGNLFGIWNLKLEIYLIWKRYSIRTVVELMRCGSISRRFREPLITMR